MATFDDEPQTGSQAPEPAGFRKCSTNVLSAGDVISGLTEQMAFLLEQAQRLEDALGASMGNSRELSSDSIQGFQATDYIRQSARDIHAVLARIAPHLCWRDGEGLSLSELDRVVEMKGSLSAHRDSTRQHQDADIWL